MKEKQEVVIGLGSNMGDRKRFLELAITEMEKVFNSKAIRSPIYESAAWGFQSDYQFLNCCIVLTTDLAPEDVLEETKLIEKKLGRVNKSKNFVYESRVVDLDILYFGDKVLVSNNLTIPHPLMYDRMFVIRPLADICPGLIDPVKKVTILELLSLCNDLNEPLLYEN